MFDPLQYGLELPLRSEAYPLGFPLTVETNSPVVLEAVRESWACYRQTFDTPPITLRVAAGEGPETAAPVPSFRGMGHLLAVVSDSRNFGVCDRTLSLAFCHLSNATVRNTAWTRYYFLDAMVYTLLTQLYLTPIHAACVARRGTGVLLCGDSGAGKSCLAYACARRGWTYLSDDASSLVRGNGAVLLGRPHQIRFRESASELFPELAVRKAVPGMNGDPSVEVPMREIPDLLTAMCCRAGYVVFLHRPAASVWLTPVDSETALSRMQETMPLYGADILEDQRESLRKLLEADDGPRAFDLSYSDLDQAIDRLERLVEQGGRK